MTSALLVVSPPPHVDESPNHFFLVSKTPQEDLPLNERSALAPETKEEGIGSITHNQ